MPNVSRKTIARGSDARPKKQYREPKSVKKPLCTRKCMCVTCVVLGVLFVSVGVGALLALFLVQRASEGVPAISVVTDEIIIGETAIDTSVNWATRAVLNDQGRRLQSFQTTSTVCAPGVSTDLVHVHGTGSGYHHSRNFSSYVSNVASAYLTPYGQDSVTSVTSTGQYARERSHTMICNPNYKVECVIKFDENRGSWEECSQPCVQIKQNVDFLRGCDSAERYYSRCLDPTDLSSCQYTCGLGSLEINFRTRVDTKLLKDRTSADIVIVPTLAAFLKQRRRVGIFNMFFENFPITSCNTTAVWRFTRGCEDFGSGNCSVFFEEQTTMTALHSEQDLKRIGKVAFRDPRGYYVKPNSDPKFDFTWNEAEKRWVGGATPFFSPPPPP